MLEKQYLITRRPALLFSNVAVCLFLLFQTTLAQYRFDSFTTDNGLPQNGVRRIAQTPDGYLWFTTFDGLVRFDGMRFTVFDKNNSPGILSNRFSSLHVEPDGTLFAGTEDGGLTVYRDGAFRTYITSDGLPSNQVPFLGTDAKGEFFIGTSAGNCYFRDGKFVSVPESEITNNFYLAPTGNLWLFGKDGIRQITPDKREITYPVKLDYFNENFDGIKLFEDSRGNLWLGDWSGVYSLKDGNITHFSAKDGVPARVILRPFVEEADGSIWFTSGYFGYTEKVGLVRFYEGRFTAWGEDAGLSNLSIHHLFKDREGTIWAATDGGLNHLRKQFIKSFSTADGLPYAEVYPLLETRNGDVYIGTVQGLSRFRDGKFNDVVVKYKGNYLSVSALHEDAEGGLWIGDPVGLYRLENEKLRKLDVLGKGIVTVTAISNDRAGNLWVGTARGLFMLKDEKVVAHLTTKEGLPSDEVKVIHQDSEGNLWVGTYGGLVKLSGPRAVPTVFTTKDGLASDRVRAIYETEDGTLWIGTYDGGLSRLAGGRFFNYTTENGLFNNGVFQILEDERSNFWISSNRGIYRVNKQELNDLADGKISKISSVSYGKADGMLNTECNGGRQPAGIKTKDGRFWFPTQEGVAIVSPNEVANNLQPPPVKIESVLIERSTTDFADGIKLAANADNLEIRYTGISFIKPEQIKFRYRIEGLDENWTDVGTIRDVYFPSLPAGEYTFHVIAANSDGVWNEQGAKIGIKVLPPFWRTWWFTSLLALTLVGLTFAGYKIRVSQLKNEKKRQEAFSRRLIDLQENERKRIAGELHDSLSQNLVIIKNRAMLSLEERDRADQAFQQLEEIAEAASDSLFEVREIAHNLRPFQIDRSGLTKAIEVLVRKTNTRELSVTAELDEIDEIFSPEMEINLYRILQESLNNIIKHSAATEANVKITQSGKMVEITIRDNGKGFDTALTRPGESQDGSGFGLAGITERARILGCVPVIESAEGQGTKIYLKVAINL